MKKYFIATISEEHALKATELGVLQVCHGKRGPLEQISCGDKVLIYSPKDRLNGSETVQAFTALGTVVGEEVYQVEQAKGFHPFRINVAYQKSFEKIPIRPLLDKLDFIKSKNHWGMYFRKGLVEIGECDFQEIVNCARL